MLEIWLARIAEEVKRRLPPKRGPEKREVTAEKYGLSRAQLNIIENGKRDYGISFLLRFLAGPKPTDDPVKVLIEGMENWKKLSAEDMYACRLLVKALSTSDKRRQIALNLLKTLEIEMMDDDDLAAPAETAQPPPKRKQEG